MLAGQGIFAASPPQRRQWCDPPGTLTPGRRRWVCQFSVMFTPRGLLPASGGPDSEHVEPVAGKFRFTGFAYARGTRAALRPMLSIGSGH